MIALMLGMALLAPAQIMHQDPQGPPSTTPLATIASQGKFHAIARQDAVDPDAVEPLAVDR